MGTLDDLRKKAQADAGKEDEDSTTWKPTEVGDELAGTITEIRYTDTRFGPTFVLNVRDEKDQLWALWLSSKILGGEMAKYAPGVGSLIVVVFGGKVVGKAGYSYNKYSVSTDSERCEEEWDAAKTLFEKTKELTAAMGSGQQASRPTAEDDSITPF